MTTFVTPSYGIAYCDGGTPILDFPGVTQSAALTIEAALTRRGIAPPNTPDLAALAARVAALEPGPWYTLSLFIGANGFVANGPAVRLEGGRVWGAGWAQAGTSGMPGSAQLLATPLPVQYRPVIPREAWAIGATGNRLYRVIVNTDGTMVAADSTLAAGQFLNFDRATWPTK